MKNLSEITDGQDIVTKEWIDDQGFMKGMTILSYGKSTWQDFMAAYTANKVVYCRASSNSNPASDPQTRLAFMAYVSNETNPTNVEFQYYRSVSSHSASQQGDQVYVYKLESNNKWTVTVREAMSKIATSGSATQSYANSTITISVPTNVSAFTNDAGYTTNIGTITGIQMNGVSKGTSGVIDLGTVITAHQDISGKVDKVFGKGLSTNDYTTNEKNKLSGIAAGAQVNVQADWNETDTTADSYILNKPNISGGSYFIDIDKWITQTATSQDYADIEDAIESGKYLYIGQEDEQSGEIFHSPVTCSMITEDSEIICYYIEDDTVHMYTFHSDGTYYYEYHYLQRKLTAGSGIEINTNNVISATGLSSATNWLNGSQTGSVRTSGSKEEDNNYTIGQYAVAEGYMTTASGYCSHAEGFGTIASGYDSHAEGDDTTASGNYSHSEGSNTTASGSYSHAEGAYTTASGYISHAEGNRTIASGIDSHVQNRYTVATETCQTVIGKYNAATVSGSGTATNPYAYADVGDYAFIIGNGTANTTADRSNALTVDWDGNLDIAGNLQIGDSAWINKVVDIDSTVAPSSDKWKTAIHIKDKNGLSLGYLEGAILSSGYNGVTLTARRDISGTNHYNGVRLLVDSSGNAITQFNDASAWREGLGLGGLATKSTVAPVTLSKTASAKYTGSISGAKAFSVSVSCAADSGYKPIAITGIYPGSTSGASEVFLRGFNMNGYNAGPTAFTVETYWRTTSSTSIPTNTFTAYVEFMTIKTALS